MTAEVMALTAVQRAVAAWEDQTPDWVMALAIACDKSTQNRVAGRIGYSAAVVSNVLKAKYSGDLKAVEGAVKGALMNETVVCPVVGDLSRQACGEHQRRPGAPHNPPRIQFFKACRGGCPHSRINQGDEG